MFQKSGFLAKNPFFSMGPRFLQDFLATDSSLNSPFLPRMTPTPWTLADEGCCSESDLLSKRFHRGPDYHIFMKGVSQGSVWDSHCHLDFLARKLKRVIIMLGERLEKSLQFDGQNLGDRFGENN